MDNSTDTKKEAFRLEVLSELFSPAGAEAAVGEERVEEGRSSGPLYLLLEKVLVIEQLYDIDVPDRDIKEENFGTLENTLRYLSAAEQRTQK